MKRHTTGQQKGNPFVDEEEEEEHKRHAKGASVGVGKYSGTQYVVGDVEEESVSQPPPQTQVQSPNQAEDVVGVYLVGTPKMSVWYGRRRHSRGVRL